MNRAIRSAAFMLQAILWIVLLAFVGLIAMSRITPFEVLVVRGGSMEPGIHLGSVVIIDRGATNLKIGDVASFREPSGDIITHRVVAIESGRYVTRGDANQQRDLDSRTSEQIVGTVLTSIPMVGYGLHALQQPIVFLALLLSTGGFLIYQELRTIAREIRRIRSERVTNGR